MLPAELWIRACALICGVKYIDESIFEHRK